MHPSVLSFWFATPDVPPAHQAAWQAQRASLSQSAAGGQWCGTITSEPGSGGDIFQTKTIAHPDSQEAIALAARSISARLPEAAVGARL